MVCAPPARVAILNVASPAPFNVADPIVAAPSLNVTVPVGVPPDPADGVTVAANVTVWPQIEGLSEEVSVVEVAAFAKPGVVLRSIVTLLPPATARSGLPSPLRSPTATKVP